MPVGEKLAHDESGHDDLPLTTHTNNETVSEHP
jgi:hypothetical protein